MHPAWEVDLSELLSLIRLSETMRSESPDLRDPTQEIEVRNEAAARAAKLSRELRGETDFVLTQIRNRALCMARGIIHNGDPMPFPEEWSSIAKLVGFDED